MQAAMEMNGRVRFGVHKGYLPGSLSTNDRGKVRGWSFNVPPEY